MGSLIDIKDKEICASAPRPTRTKYARSQNSEVPNSTLCSSISNTLEIWVGGMQKCAVIDAPGTAHPLRKSKGVREPRVSGLYIPVDISSHVSCPWLVPNVRAQCSQVIHGFHVQWHRASMGKGLDCSTEEKDLSFDNSTITGVSLDYMPK